MSEPLSRQEKIKALQDIRDGIPAKFALNPRRYQSLELDWKKSRDCYYTSDGEAVSFEDKEKYLNPLFTWVSVSGMTKKQIDEYDKTGILPEYKADKKMINN